MSALLTCENLTKRYTQTPALNSISFTLTPGRIVGLLGPNGSGKSTLLKLIAGILTPTDGDIRINGQAPGVASKEAIAYLPDCMCLNDNMTVEQLVTFFSTFYSNFRTDKAYEMIAALNLDPKKKFKTLSKGTKEKIQLILTMARDAQLYLLDEPIGGVDPAARDYILDTILRNRPENATILISTHLISDIENVLDDVLFINQGEISLFTSVEDIRNNYHSSVDGYFREVYKC